MIDLHAMLSQDLKDYLDVQTHSSKVRFTSDLPPKEVIVSEGCLMLLTPIRSELLIDEVTQPAGVNTEQQW